MSFHMSHRPTRHSTIHAAALTTPSALALPLHAFAAAALLSMPPSLNAATCWQKILSPVAVPGAIPSDQSGWSVACGHGRALLGAPVANGPLPLSGVVRISFQTEGGWSDGVAMAAPDSWVFDRFGHAITTFDADRAVVGAPGQDAFGSEAGAVYVMRFEGAAWAVEAKLAPGVLPGMPAPGAQFGSVVAADPLAGLVVASAPAVVACGGESCDNGRVCVYRELDGVWSLEATLVPEDGAANCAFGAAVAVRGDMVIVGAPADDDAGTNAGALYVFERLDGAWQQSRKIVAPSPLTPSASFGSAVGLSDAEAFVGAPGNDGAGTDRGAFMVLDRSAAEWPVVAQFDGSTDGRGLAATMSVADDRRVLVTSKAEGKWVTLYGDMPGEWSVIGLVSPTIEEWSPQLDTPVKVAAASGDLVAVGYQNPCAPATCLGGLLVGSLAWAADCNDDGLADPCDIAIGVSTDLNGNGVPDECDDCDGNGVPDQVDLAEGVLVDCNGDFQPDLCAIAADPTLDCTGNGVLDVCDIASGLVVDCDDDDTPDDCEIAANPALDCNGNGVLDICDIASGLVVDCDSDLVPDLCAIAADPSLDCDDNGLIDACEPLYAVDDHTATTAWGIESGDIDIVWMNVFEVTPGKETLVAVEICWSWQFPPSSSQCPLPLGHPFTVLLLGDPDGDGDPSDATILASVPSTILIALPDVFQSVPVPPTALGVAGQTFFVAAMITLGPGGCRYPATANRTPPIAPASWIGAGPAGSGLAGIAQFTNVGAIETPSEFLLRGVALGPSAIADLDCDGAVGPGDLGLLLSAWGECPPEGCPADFDRSGVVDGADLGAMLTWWGAGSG